MINRLLITIALLMPVLLFFGAIVYFLFDINGAFSFNVYTILGWLIIAFNVYKVGQYSRKDSVDRALTAPINTNSATNQFDDDETKQGRKFGLYGSGYSITGDINQPED
ncbi:hypothetical protein [Marinobacter salicampi]|uniref:hypothetical protein n=1 Tax=Marinobacter salicampi TaxID=435907 RepID=UPI00140D0B3E|nr:hypothetical protein [Marinobacter salicampi]